MEKRRVEQIRVWKLLLHPRGSKEGVQNLVAISVDRNRLHDWIDSLKVDPYGVEGREPKVFKKGSPLEFYYPIGRQNGGVYDVWVTVEGFKSWYNTIKNDPTKVAPIVIDCEYLLI